MAEPQQFTLPDVGEGLTEAEIVTWHVQVMIMEIRLKFKLCL